MSIIICSLHQIYWNDQIKKYEMGRTHRYLVEKINACKCVVRNPEEKRQVARHRCRLKGITHILRMRFIGGIKGTQ
jgi:hypothetical protein